MQNPVAAEFFGACLKSQASVRVLFGFPFGHGSIIGTVIAISKDNVVLVSYDRSCEFMLDLSEATFDYTPAEESLVVTMPSGSRITFVLTRPS